MQGCLSEVSVGKPTTKLVEKEKKFQTSVFYEEDRFFLNYDLRKRLRNFVEEHPNQKRFVVIGFTDGCGSHSYNKELSLKRAKEVAYYLISLVPGSLIEIEWKGEATGEHTIRGRRVDVAVYKKVSSSEAPPKIISDFYLIDGSGSMFGDKWNKWTNAIAHWKPKGSRVFVANSGYIPRWSILQTIRPSGGTEIWLALWTVLDFMKSGQNITIISDFHSNIPLSVREQERMNTKINQRGVRVRYISP